MFLVDFESPTISYTISSKRGNLLNLSISDVLVDFKSSTIASYPQHTKLNFVSSGFLRPS